MVFPVLSNILEKKTTYIICTCIFLLLYFEVFAMSLLNIDNPGMAYVFSRIQKYSRFVLIFIYFYYFVYRSFEKRRFFVFLILLFFVCFAKFKWAIFDLFFIPILLSGLVSSKLVYKFSLLGLLFGCLCVCCMSYFGLFHDVTFYRAASIRYHLGFSHPNAFGFTLTIVGMLYTLLYYRIKFYNCFFVLLFLSLFCYFVPNSVTASSVIFLLFIILLAFRAGLFNFVLLHKKLILILTFFILFLFIFLFFYISVTHHGLELFKNKILETFGARLTLTGEALKSYDFSLLGQKTLTSGNLDILLGRNTSLKYMVMDSLYISFPIRIGVLPGIMFAICYVIAMTNTIIRNNFMLFFIQLLLLIYSFSESYVINTSLMAMFIFVFPFSTEYFTSEDNCFKVKL